MSAPLGPVQPGIDEPFTVPFVHRLRFTSDVLRAQPEILAEALEPSDGRRARIQIWVDDHVWESRSGLEAELDAFARRFRDRVECVGAPIVVTGGERIKNDVQALEPILKAFHDADLDRRSYVVVIGGGAVLDAIGFAAAIAHRGIRLVRLPTTTLAQADSGVGVKNGVNLFGKKNWLGAFAVPWAVINDQSLLQTLPDRDFRAGFSEAVKVTLLKSPAGFGRLERDAARIARREPRAVDFAIRESVRLHLDHITKGGDPFEALEARPLDFGHWSAHKLEALRGFELRHGEAVAIGVAIDTVYSSLATGLDTAVADRTLRCLAALGLPIDDPALEDTEALFDGLEEFRQHLGGRLTLTMLAGLGHPIDVHNIDRSKMEAAIEHVRVEAKRLDTPQAPAGRPLSPMRECSRAAGQDQDHSSEADLLGPLWIRSAR